MFTTFVRNINTFTNYREELDFLLKLWLQTKGITDIYQNQLTVINVNNNKDDILTNKKYKIITIKIIDKNNNKNQNIYRIF